MTGDPNQTTKLGRPYTGRDMVAETLSRPNSDHDGCAQGQTFLCHV
jgi:hypothetical protein